MPELKRSRLSVWIQVARIFSFTASLTPVCIAAALAFAYGESSAWVLFPLVAACALLFHAGTNVVSEYFDFKKGVDTSYKFGSSRVLVDGLMPPGQVLIGGYALFAAGFLIGLILVAVRGWPVFILGVIGLLGGLFYSASPIG
ncbi:MAG: prenyltransferase, partial [Deltaproteobacteria bacterium]